MSEKSSTPATPRCPICEKPVDPHAKSFPFCSERCRVIDLGKWARGDYKISRPLDQKDLEDGE